MIAWDVSCLLTVKPWGSDFVRHALQEAGQRKRRLKSRFGTQPGVRRFQKGGGGQLTFGAGPILGSAKEKECSPWLVRRT